MSNLDRFAPGPVLVIAAHPDDEVLGCGGTIARMTYEGRNVVIAIFGEGITSRADSRDRADTESMQRLHKQARDAGKLLGVNDVRLIGLPDNRFDTIPLLDIVKLVEKLVDEIQPSVILTHDAGDLNIDHVILHRAVMTATRPTENHPVKEVYTFEIASSTEWAFQQFQPAFRPNVFVDIKDTLEAKIEAMQIYESEAREFPHPRSPRALTAIAERWGSVAGLHAAEALQLVRSIR